MKKHHQFALGASVLALSVLTGYKAHALSVSQIAQAATPVANQYGLYPSVMIAQGILESSHGQSALATNYFNIFGVKYSSGTPVYLPTQEFLNGQMQNVVEPFQRYSSLYEACLAHAQLLRGSRLYSGAWRENTSSYADATAWLQGRYATDPNYASKLNYLIAELGLTAYDGGGVPASHPSALTSSSTSSSTTSSAVTGAGSYTVQAGDTLSAIALRHGTTVATLVSINHLANANSISVGQVLTLSGNGGSSYSSTASSSSSSAGTYTVQAGDALSSIAMKYGTTVQALLAANHLSSPDRLYVGQQLQIASSSSSYQSTSATGGGHTVQAGESLYSIAQANGTTPEKLAALNGITISTTIHPGQLLKV